RGAERCWLKILCGFALCNSAPFVVMLFRAKNLTTRGTELHKGKTTESRMPNTHDIVVIGGGHNGLVTACYLPRAGFKPLVLERPNQVGGAGITEEFHPGFRTSVLAPSAGPLLAEVVRDMQLERQGLKIISPEIAVTTLSPAGRALVIPADINKAAEEIAQFSQADAARYSELRPALETASRVIAETLWLTTPDIANPT